jgi:hypothetical protein
VCVEWGDLYAAVTGEPGQTGVRAAIIVLKPVKAGGAKGSREVEMLKKSPTKENPEQVPVRDRQTGEADPRGRVERSV